MFRNNWFVLHNRFELDLDLILPSTNFAFLFNRQKFHSTHKKQQQYFYWSNEECKACDANGCIRNDAKRSHQIHLIITKNEQNTYRNEWAKWMENSFWSTSHHLSVSSIRQNIRLYIWNKFKFISWSSRWKFFQSDFSSSFILIHNFNRSLLLLLLLLPCIRYVLCIVWNNGIRLKSATHTTESFPRKSSFDNYIFGWSARLFVSTRVLFAFYFKIDYLFLVAAYL